MQNKRQIQQIFFKIRVKIKERTREKKERDVDDGKMRKMRVWIQGWQRLGQEEGGEKQQFIKQRCCLYLFAEKLIKVMV